MADDVILDAGSGGDTVAADDIAGVKHQRVKVTLGADGVNDGDVSDANPLPIDDAGGSLTVDIGAAATAAGDLAKAEDAVHASGDVGVMALGVRKDTPVTTAADGDYTPLLTSDEGALWIENVPSEEDAGNSSTSTLTASSVFTGTGVDLLHHQSVTVAIDASHDSAVDGMQFQFSTDNVNWDISLDFTYTVNGGRTFQFGTYARYFRVVYTNGGTGQTHFRCQTILHHGTTLTTIHRLGDNASADRSSEITKAVIIAQAAGSGDFVPVQATAAGNFKMALEEIDAALTGGGVEAAALLVTLANDSTGLLSIDDNGGSITIDAASLPLPTGAATAAAQLPDGHNVTVDNASLVVDGSAVTQPISAASLPLPTGAATAAAQLADGHNVAALGAAAHDAAASGNPVAVSGVAQNMDDTAPPNRVSAEGDVARQAVDRDGAAFVHPHGPQIWSYHIDGTAALTDATVHAAPGAGLSIYVTDIVFSAGAATAINAFLEEGATTVLGPYYLEAVAGRGMALHFQTPKKITANTALTITTSAAIAHSVDITGFIGAA